MIIKIILIFFLKAAVAIDNVNTKQENKIKNDANLINELTDEKWVQIQKGEWLVGFFDNDTEESKELENYWQLFAHKCKDFKINVGKIFAPENPGLYVRFLVSVFPKAFYIKNGVAHEIPKVNKDAITELIKDQKWNKLKPVNFLSNPFSVQMSLLSHLFIHAVNLYNYENDIVQQFIPAQSATDVAFALTFIIVGSVLGLLLTLTIAFVQIFFMESKEREINDNCSDDDEKEKERESSEKSSGVRKRK